MVKNKDQYEYPKNHAGFLARVRVRVRGAVRISDIRPLFHHEGHEGHEGKDLFKREK